MNIEFLDNVLSTVFALRRLKKITVMQQDNTWKLRSNMHCLIVMPFGHQKSTITRNLPDEQAFYKCDTFTEASFKGSISQNGDLVPPIVRNFGGKVVFIDEWNSVGRFAQNSLLSVMENQEFSRSLGFSYRGEWKYEDEYMTLRIKENEVSGNPCHFSIVAFAMSYPKYAKSQSSMALLSRFMPVFIESSHEMVQAMMTGDWHVNLMDASNNIDEVVIGKELFFTINSQIWAHIQKENLLPDDPDQNGFVIRAQGDIVRLGIARYFIEHKDEIAIQYKRKSGQKKRNVLEITDPKPFIDSIAWMGTIVQQYMNPKTKGKVEMFRALYDKYPDEAMEFYAKRLGVTPQQASQYKMQLLQQGVII